MLIESLYQHAMNLARTSRVDKVVYYTKNDVGPTKDHRPAESTCPPNSAGRSGSIAQSSHPVVRCTYDIDLMFANARHARAALARPLRRLPVVQVRTHAGSILTPNNQLGEQLLETGVWIAPKKGGRPKRSTLQARSDKHRVHIVSDGLVGRFVRSERAGPWS